MDLAVPPRKCLLGKEPSSYQKERSLYKGLELSGEAQIFLNSLRSRSILSKELSSLTISKNQGMHNLEDFTRNDVPVRLILNINQKYLKQFIRPPKSQSFLFLFFNFWGKAILKLWTWDGSL